MQSALFVGVHSENTILNWRHADMALHGARTRSQPCAVRDGQVRDIRNYPNYDRRQQRVTASVEFELTLSRCTAHEPLGRKLICFRLSCTLAPPVWPPNPLAWDLAQSIPNLSFTPPLAPRLARHIRCDSVPTLY